MTVQMTSYLAEITSASDPSVVWERHCDALLEFGFDKVAYGYTNYRNADSIGSQDDLLILTTANLIAYAKEYLDTLTYKNGPMLAWAMANDGAMSWSVLQDRMASGTLSKAEEAAIAFNQSHGLYAGITVSFSSRSQRSKGTTALCAKDGMGQAEVDAVWEEHGSEISTLCHVTHLKLISLPYQRSRPLTTRQIEVLQWVGDGKTAQDIAILLGVSSATVEKHLRLARDTLNVETTAQAVMKAAFENQMFTVTP